MKVVLDTNALLVALPSNSRHYPIFHRLVKNRYTLLISTDIYLEYLEVLSQKASPSAVETFVDVVYKLQNIEVVDVRYFWNLIAADPDDNKFVDCALAGNADYLVTNDNHFNVLKQHPFPKVNVIAADDFLELISDE